MSLVFRQNKDRSALYSKLSWLFLLAAALNVSSAFASTICSANVTIPAVGFSSLQNFDIFQSGNCDNDAIGLFAGTNVPIANNPVGLTSYVTATGSNGNTYLLKWSGAIPDVYYIYLYNQVASGPETLTYSYFYDDGSANPGFRTNGTFAVYLTPPALPPGAPTIGTATVGNAQATVSFTPPASNGGGAIAGYTVTSSPGGITATGAASPITVTGLTNGTPYTFTVTAMNSGGTGSASAASNSVTPKTVPGAPTIGTATGAMVRHRSHLLLQPRMAA